MTASDVEFRFFSDDGDFDIEAWFRGTRIGYVRCDREETRLLIAELQVLSEVPQRWPVIPGVLELIVGPRPPLCPRGTGIGRAMLTQLIRTADGAGIEEMWGSVMPKDMVATPYLLGWYERLGFSVVDPDDECVKGAAKKIVRRRADSGA